MSTPQPHAAEPSLVEELAIGRRLLGARLRGQMQYRTSFIMQIVGNFAIHAAELVAVFALFSTIDALGGWSAGEVAFLYAVSYISFALAHIASTGLQGFSRMIVRGDFDRVLTRPMNPFLQVLSSDITLRQVGSLIQGLLAFCVALTLVDVQWSLPKLLYIPIFMISASALYVMLFSLEATLCFWTTESNEAVNAVTYGGKTLAVYPMHIYDVWLRRLFLFVIPLGFVTFLPVSYVLDKPLPLNLPDWTRLVAPLVTAAFGFVAAFFWRRGIRRYRSTGS